MSEDTGTRGQVARDTEVFLMKLFATMSIKVKDLKQPLPYDDTTLQALKGLEEEFPPLDTFSRAPNIGNLISMLCEVLIGHKVKYILDADTKQVTKVRLNYTNRLCINPTPPYEEEWDPEEESEESEEE